MRTSPTSSLEDKWFRGHWRRRRPQLPQELSRRQAPRKQFLPCKMDDLEDRRRGLGAKLTATPSSRAVAL